MAKSKECYDHLGNRFNSIKEMCLKWGISQSLYVARINYMGWTLEDTLTKNVLGGEVTDHIGNKFKSVKEMLNYWNVTEVVYYSRKGKKYNLEQCLTGKEVRVGGRSKGEVTDHIGNKFNSQKELCRHWGVAYSTYRYKISLGQSIEEILTYKDLKISSKKCEDHLGNNYNSISEMCKQWDVPVQTYRNRLLCGHSLQDALTGKKIKKQSKMVEFKDHLGKTYRSLREISMEYGIDSATLTSRLNKEYPLEEALGLKGRGLRKRVGTKFHNIEFIKYLYKGRNDVDYYLCKVDGVEKILNENSWYTYIRR